MITLNKTSTVETLSHLTDDIIIEYYHDAHLIHTSDVRAKSNKYI